MKQVTAQQFANIFGVWVAKDSDGIVYAYKNKPSFIADKMSWFENLGICKGINIFVSDDDTLDWNILIEPQEEKSILNNKKCTFPEKECKVRDNNGKCSFSVVCKRNEPQEETASIDDLLLQEICSLKEQLKIALYQLRKYNTEYKECDYLHDIGTLDFQSFMQEETPTPEPVLFDENYAPNGYKAVKSTREEKHFLGCPLKCAFLSKQCCNLSSVSCMPNERPDRTDVFFVKKEDEK